MLNLFYAEPDADRWLPFDRYPRRLVRRVLRGPPRPSGQMRVFLNLRAGLDRLGVAYRVNDYRHARTHPGEVACIVGKPFLLDQVAWKNPIVFGAAVHSHPLGDPALPRRLPVRKILVPGPWMKDMCVPIWGDIVEAWPVGIDTDRWRPHAGKDIDVLVYDKIRWHHERYEALLLDPVRALLRRAGRSSAEIRYGHYREEEFEALLARSRSMIFVCEHETQGIAYQQALSCGVPILAWDRGGAWQDPQYFPHEVFFEPVTSVPYWDERCGERFAGPEDLEAAWPSFWDGVVSGRYSPRAYIQDNLTLEECARRYLEIVGSVLDSAAPSSASSKRKP
jgi:hypothetical protein